MMNLFKYILFGVLGYNVYKKFAGDISKFNDWTYSIQDIFFTSVTAQSIKGTILWVFNNKTAQAGRIKDVEVQILYKGSVLGYVSSPGPYAVPGNGSAQIDTSFELSLGAVGSKALDMLQELGANNDVQLTLQGSARASAGPGGIFITIPINKNTTAKTILSWFK